MLVPWKESYVKPRQCIKKQRHYFADKGLYNWSYGFSSSHVLMWELDYKEVKAVLRGRFIALQAYLNKQDKNQINNLTLHLKQLEKEEMKNPSVIGQVLRKE